MDGVNLQASMHNLSQMDRHQHDVHRAPVENQIQNIVTAREDSARRIDMPVEPDQADNKTVDPNDRRQENENRRKKRGPGGRETKHGDRNSDAGHFVDLSA